MTCLNARQTCKTIRCAHCGYRVTGELHKRRYTYYRCAQVQYHDHPIRPAWVPEGTVEAQIIAMLDRIVPPQEVYDWAMAYLKRTAVQDAADTKREPQKLQEVSLLQRRIAQAKARAREDGDRAAKVLERAQHLAARYVTLSAPQKWQIADAVFLNITPYQLRHTFAQAVSGAGPVCWTWAQHGHNAAAGAPAKGASFLPWSSRFTRSVT